MRILNEEEKKLCAKILTGAGRNNYLGNLIDDKLDGVRVHIIRSLKKVELLFQTQTDILAPEEQEALIDRIIDTTNELIMAIKLIHLMENEGYIFLVQNANQVDDEKQFGRGVGNAPSVASDLSDSKIATLLMDYTDKEIYITEEFKEFCANGFIAKDQYRFQRQIKVAAIALIVAALALVLNTFFNAWTKLSGGTTIKQEQIDTLVHGLKAIENKINKDTVKVYLPPVKTVTPVKKAIHPKSIKHRRHANTLPGRSKMAENHT